MINQQLIVKESSLTPCITQGFWSATLFEGGNKEPEICYCARLFPLAQDRFAVLLENKSQVANRLLVMPNVSALGFAACGSLVRVECQAEYKGPLEQLSMEPFGGLLNTMKESLFTQRSSLLFILSIRDIWPMPSVTKNVCLT